MTAPITVRRASSDADYQAIYRIWPRCPELGRPQTPKMLREMPSNVWVLVAERKGTVRAFIVARERLNGTGTTVYDFGTEPAFRGLGLGCAIMEFLMSKVAAIQLKVARATPAARWYATRGFKVTGAEAARTGKKMLLMEWKNGTQED